MRTDCRLCSPDEPSCREHGEYLCPKCHGAAFRAGANECLRCDSVFCEKCAKDYPACDNCGDIAAPCCGVKVWDDGDRLSPETDCAVYCGECEGAEPDEETPRRVLRRLERVAW